MKSVFSFLNHPPFSTFEAQIVSVLKDAPALPSYFKDGLVQYSPIIALIFGLIHLATASFYMRFISIYSLIYFLGSLITGLLMIFSFTELKEKNVLGWRMLFLASNIGILLSVVKIDILAIIVGGGISWYFLTQVRSRYS